MVGSQHRGTKLALALSFCILEAFFIAIRRLGDLSRHVPEAVILLLGAGAIYVFACYVAVNQPNSSKLHHFGAFVTAGAVVFRLTLWPLYPSLSDDPFRYRWEGKLQAAGGNPYQVRPADPAWIVLRDPTYPRVVGKDFKAVYG